MTSNLDEMYDEMLHDEFRTGATRASSEPAKGVARYRTAALVKGMVNAVRIPITCKMRLGWDDENLTAPDLARALEDAGATAIMVHGRVEQQGTPAEMGDAALSIYLAH